ncbi:MAG: 50S ribosomal protein L29 [Myxococcota bacterium]
MKAEELRKLASAELAQKIEETRNELFNVRVKHATGQLENTAMIRTLKREIARMESILGETREATT